MMGYAKQGQNTKGIHLRLYSRAFIIEVNHTQRFLKGKCHEMFDQFFA